MVGGGIMDNVNQWGQFILAAALLSLRRLASLPPTRAWELIRTITVHLWNARVKKWKSYSDWNLICFCLCEQSRQKALHRSSLRLGFSPGGFICIQGGLKGPTAPLPSISSVSVLWSEYVLWAGLLQACSKRTGAQKRMQVGQRAHTRARRDTCCLQLSRHGSS